MDQVRVALSWLQRHHFWVLSGVVAVIALLSWYSASSALDDEFAQNESTIKGQFNAVDGVSRQPFLANPEINERQRQEIADQRRHVDRIWQRLYERQRETVLRWPSALSQRFHDQVETLSFEDEIPRDRREEYMNYIDNHFPELPEKIGARVLPLGEMRGAGRALSRSRGVRGGGELRMGLGQRGVPRGEMQLGELDDEEHRDYLVEWVDQADVRAELYFPERPSSIEIWVAQENLWVYHTLLDVIRNTNEAAGADRHSDAAVRVIYRLEVGQPAALGARGSGRIYMPEVAAAPMRGEMPMHGREMPMGPEGAASPYGPYGPGDDLGMHGRMDGEMGVAGEQERIALLSGRYLDADGQPIQVTSPTPSPGEFGTEYKRLPVRMELEMDVRWLSHLIAECASQPLQVEVDEVRVNPPDAGGTGGRFGGGRHGTGGTGSDSPFARTRGSGELRTFKAQPNIATVVIQGIIYIFNEPDSEALQTTDEHLAEL